MRLAAWATIAHVSCELFMLVWMVVQSAPAPLFVTVMAVEMSVVAALGVLMFRGVGIGYVLLGAYVVVRLAIGAFAVDAVMAGEFERVDPLFLLAILIAMPFALAWILALVAAWRRGALLAALLGLSACVEWRPEAVPAPGSRAADRLSSQARIVTRDGRELFLRDPYVQNDSLIGVAPREHGGDPEAVGVALKDIQSFEARRPSVGRSAALAAGIVGGVIVVLNVLNGKGS